MTGWRFGGQSATAPLRKVLLRPPGEAFGGADPAEWHYTARPDLEKACREHAGLAGQLRQLGVEVLLHDEPLPGLADSIYVFDPLLLTNRGTVQLRMGKVLRRGEEAALAARLERMGIPRLGEIQAPGTLEGGDLLWLDSVTLAAGRGFRSNRAGLAQLADILAPAGVTVVSFDLPCFTGPAACLHLLSLLSLVREDLAVIYEPLLPVALWEELKARGIQTIPVSDEEFRSMGTNILSLGEGRCLMLEGNNRTRDALEAEGCRVYTYRGDEISLKAEGGPTCLTLPIQRG